MREVFEETEFAWKLSRLVVPFPTGPPISVTECSPMSVLHRARPFNYSQMGRVDCASWNVPSLTRNADTDEATGKSPSTGENLPRAVLSQSTFGTAGTASQSELTDTREPAT